LTNPTNGSATNLLNIYNLATGAGAPYQPTLSAAPTDWNIAINYSSISNCARPTAKVGTRILPRAFTTACTMRSNSATVSPNG